MKLVNLGSVYGYRKVSGSHRVLISPKGRTGVDSLVVDLVAVYGGVVYNEGVALAVIVTDLESSLQVGKTAVIVESAVVYSQLGVYSTVQQQCLTIRVEGTSGEGCGGCAPSPEVVNVAAYVEGAVLKHRRRLR